MNEVGKKESLKLFDTCFIYPIYDSHLVSPTRVVPKKSSFTALPNEKGEFIPTQTVTGWRVCIEYRRINDATKKDHFPLPFIDHTLERLASHE